MYDSSSCKDVRNLQKDQVCNISTIGSSLAIDSLSFSTISWFFGKFVTMLSWDYVLRGRSKMTSPGAGGGGSTKLVTNGDIGGRGVWTGGDVTTWKKIIARFLCISYCYCLYSCLSLSFCRCFAGKWAMKTYSMYLLTIFLKYFRKVNQEKSLSPFGPVT